MNDDSLSSQEQDVEELAPAEDAAVEDYLGPDILSDVTQLYFNDIGQNELLSVEEEVRHARRVKEGDFAERLAALQERHPDVTIGSYPARDERGWFVRLILKSTDPARLREATDAVAAILAGG